MSVMFHISLVLVVKVLKLHVKSGLLMSEAVAEEESSTFKVELSKTRLLHRRFTFLVWVL